MWREDYESMVEAVPEIMSVMSWDEFKEAKQLVSTRAYDIGYTDGTTR